MEPLPTIPLGDYEHYKQHRYRVMGIARHSETLEPMVIYRALYGDHSTWVRPATMFLETVIVDGRSVPRFRPIIPTEDSKK